MEEMLENNRENDAMNHQEPREITLEKKPAKSLKKVFHKNSGRKNLLIWILILIGILLFGYFSTQMMQPAEVKAKLSPYIGVVYVEGEIGSGNVDSFGIPYGYQHRWTLDQMDQMIFDDNNKGMVLFVDSPGGGVYESDELYFKIKEYQEMTGRPVYAAMGSMAASGGYYISAPADKIYANRNTWTGSIGVTIGTLFDISDLLEKYGIQTVTIAEGRNKAMGSSTDALTKEQEDILRGLVHDAYLQFVGIVSEERNIDMKKATELADGRIYTAKQAKDLNLIDGICTLNETVDKMQEDYDLQGCNIVDIVYEDHSFMGTLLGKINMKQSNGKTNDLGILMDLVEKESQFPIAYLYQR